MACSGSVTSGAAIGVGDGGVRQAGDGDDVARMHLLDRDAVEAGEGHQLGQAAGFHHRAVLAQHADRHVDAADALLDAAGQDAAEEVVALQDRRVHRERLVELDLRRRHVLQDQVEHRRQVLARAFQLEVRPALPAGGEQGVEVELLIRRAEGGEQVEHLVVDLIGAGVLAVHLVDDDDRAQAAGQRLGQHELGLRQRALRRVAQHDGAVDHRQDALHLAAEIGVAGRVHDVDLHALPLDRGGLGQDGDAALALEVVAVHGAFGDVLVGAEGAGLLQQVVHQRGLAVVDVRDDRDVADFHLARSGSWARPHLSGGDLEGRPVCLAGRLLFDAAHT
jgi:hypothetical protein